MLKHKLLYFFNLKSLHLISLSCKRIAQCVAIFLSNYSFADCTFIINNYTDTKVIAEVGFSNHINTQLQVSPASANNTLVKSTYNCKSTSPAGLGLAYITLITKQSHGGWIYIPQSSTIRALGKSSFNAEWVVGTSPLGTKLILFNNSKTSDNLFEVKIELAGRNISRQLGSMD